MYSWWRSKGCNNCSLSLEACVSFCLIAESHSITHRVRPSAVPAAFWHRDGYIHRAESHSCTYRLRLSAVPAAFWHRNGYMQGLQMAASKLEMCMQPFDHQAIPHMYTYLQQLHMCTAATLERQELSRTYLAHHELEGAVIMIYCCYHYYYLGNPV